MSPVIKMLKRHVCWQETTLVLMKAGRVQCGIGVIVLSYFNKILLHNVHSYPGSALVPSEESSLVRFQDSHTSLL